MFNFKSKIFFPKKFLGIPVKYFVTFQILVVLGVAIFWVKDVVNDSKQSKGLEEEFYKAELVGKIIKVEKNHGTCSFVLDNDSSEYVVGFARNNNYSPSDLLEYISVNNYIMKESNSNVILINDTFKFILFEEIN